MISQRALGYTATLLFGVEGDGCVLYDNCVKMIEITNKNTETNPVFVVVVVSANDSPSVDVAAVSKPTVYG